MDSIDYVRYLGHSFFEISLNRRIIYTDPFFDDFGDRGEERRIKCPLGVSDVLEANLILLSNEQISYFEKESVERIAERTGAMVVAPMQIASVLSLPKNQVIAVKIGDYFRSRGVSINVVGSNFPRSEYAVGYVVSSGGPSVYFAGPTAAFNEMVKITPDVALLPIGGTYSMGVLDAAGAVKTLRPKLTVPMHYSTFKKIIQDPFEFKKKLEKFNFNVAVLEPGQRAKFKLGKKSKEGLL